MEKKIRGGRIDVTVNLSNYEHIWFTDDGSLKYGERNHKVEEIIRKTMGKEIREKLADMILDGEVPVYIRLADTYTVEVSEKEFEEMKDNIIEL